jgi:ABC-type nitrate/sulfonate/bicarbonate transport system permease component
MAEAGRLTSGTPAEPLLGPVTMLRVAIIVTVLAVWQLLAVSGWLYRDVVPSLPIIGVALLKTLSDPGFYFNLWATVYEIAIGLVVGGACGMAVGLALGGNRLMSKAFEAYLYYLGPTPKIIFFPVMIMWFGIGPGSKVAMGAISCFFPIALSVASGMRQIDRVLIRVGRSFRCGTWQMVTKIYLPAMRAPVLNGVRLGLGVALIGTLLAETKLSNQGIGFLVIQSYNTFNMPEMYSLLIVLFVLAIGMNAIISRFAVDDRTRR